MKAPLLERSKYYKGLLVLMGRDRIIDPRERELMILIGGILDFDSRFCEAAIDDLLRNKYITDQPVIFSDREMLRCFLHDAVRLALVDGEIHPQELSWLRAIVRANGLTDEYLEAEIHDSELGWDSHNRLGSLAIRKYLASEASPIR